MHYEEKQALLQLQLERVREDYTIRYDKVDLDTCKFYRLTLLEK